MTAVINLFGPASVGKSSLMAAVFAEMKRRNHSVEMAPEYAKELIWSGSTELLTSNPYLVWAEQLHRVRRMLGKVDFVVTDGPPMLAVVYGNGSPEFEALARSEHGKLHNVDFFVRRTVPFVGSGRFPETLEEQFVNERKIYDLTVSLSEGRHHTVDVTEPDVVNLICNIAQSQALV